MSARRTEVREECLAGQRVLRRIADRWSCLVITHLVEGPMHFNALRRSLKGISQWSLTRAVRGLEREGILSRMDAPTTPPRVEYELTELGRSLLEQLRSLGGWALKREPAIRQARERFDGRPAALKCHRLRRSRARSGSA